MQVIVEGDIIYSDPKTQEKLLDLEKKFENSRYGAESIYSQFWLRSFLKRMERRKDWKKAITDEKSFVKVVKEVSNYNFSSPLIYCQPNYVNYFHINVLWYIYIL